MTGKQQQAPTKVALSSPFSAFSSTSSVTTSERVEGQLLVVTTV